MRSVANLPDLRDQCHQLAYSIHTHIHPNTIARYYITTVVVATTHTCTYLPCTVCEPIRKRLSEENDICTRTSTNKTLLHNKLQQLCVGGVSEDNSLLDIPVCMYACYSKHTDKTATGVTGRGVICSEH